MIIARFAAACLGLGKTIEREARITQAMQGLSLEEGEEVRELVLKSPLDWEEAIKVILRRR